MKTKLIALFLMLLCLAGCASDPAVPVTFTHVHVSGCNDNHLRMDVIAINGTIVPLDFHSEPAPPFCSTWERATYWDITYFGDSVDGKPHFKSAKVSP